MMDTIFPISRRKPAAGRQRLTAIVLQIVSLLVFLSLVFFLREFRPEAAGFDEKGALLLLYHVCRLCLLIYIMILCFTAGYKTLELFRVDPGRIFDSARKSFILCFFLGASLYGIGFTILGLWGFINVGTGLASTIPLLLFSHSPIRALFTDSPRAAACRSSGNVDLGPFFGWLVLPATVGTALLFLLTRVVFVVPIDNDVWEHYFHWYRHVIATGSTQPNEVWLHFYISGGAGLIFLANTLSDFFGAQLVSACFVAAAGLVILDLLLEYCRSTSWAAFGVTVFLAFLFGVVWDGSMFKHHAVLLGYASFALWGSAWLQLKMGYQLRPLRVVLVVSLGYLAFYMPVAGSILFCTFSLLTLGNFLLGAQYRWRGFAQVTGGLLVGIVLRLVTNYVITGLPEIVPIQLFWKIADQGKAQEILGLGGIEYFLTVNNDLLSEQTRTLKFLLAALRHSKTFLAVSVLYVLVVVVKKRLCATFSEPEKFLALLGAFILPLGAFALVVQHPSVNRMSLFSIVYMTLAIVVLLKMVADSLVGSRLWATASRVIIVLGMVIAIGDSFKKARETLPTIERFALGTISLRGALETMEDPAKGAQGMKIVTMISRISEFRKNISPDDLVLSLTYDPGFSYTLPAGGIMSEPSYSLVRNRRELFTAETQQVIDHLKARQIKYLFLNLQSRLFSTFAFTTLFDTHELARYFSVAYEDGDLFILTWRRTSDAKPLPDRMLSILELKRSGVLHFPFTERFMKLLTHGEVSVPRSEEDDQLVHSLSDFETVREVFEDDLDRVFRSELLPVVPTRASRILLLRILNATKTALQTADLNEVLGVQREKSDNVRLFENLSRRDLKAHLVRFSREVLAKEYQAEVGPALARLSQRCDERVSFAASYPMWAKCT